MRKAINDWLRIAEARTISDCASSNRKSHDLMTNSRFNVSHSALTGGEPPQGFRTARARSAFYPVPVFCTIIGTFVTATPGHVTPWTRCYRCSRPSTVPTVMTSLRIDSSDFPSPGLLSQRRCHPRLWNGNVPGKCQPIARDYRPVRSTSSRASSFLRRSPTFRVFVNGILRPARRRPITSLSVFTQNAESEVSGSGLIQNV